MEKYLISLLVTNSMVKLLLFCFWVTGLQGKGEGISLILHYHFHPLHGHIDISRAITAESSPLHIASNQTRTGKPLVSERKSLTTKLHLQILNFYLAFFHSQTCGEKPNSTLSEKFGEIKPFPDIWLIIFKLFFYIFLKELDSCPSPQISYICYYILKVA